MKTNEIFEQMVNMVFNQNDSETFSEKESEEFYSLVNKYYENYKKNF